MKIFITGATGFIGSHLVEELNKRSDVSITLHTRQAGSLTDKNYLRRILADKDIVIHTAAILNAWGTPWSKFVENNILPVRNLIECSPANLKQFIFISSVHVLGVKHSDAELPLNEESPYQPSTLYAKSKVEAEKLVKNSNLPFTIIRPAIVYGPGDKKGMIPKIIDMVKKNKMILPGSGNNLVHFIYIDDLVNAVLASINNPKTFKQILILAGPRPIRIKDFVDLIASLTGVKKIKTIPYFLSFCAAQIFKLISSDKKEPVIYPNRLDIICGNRFFSTDKAHNLLNWEPKIDYKEGLNAIIK